MADVLDRVLWEIRERKEQARDAVEQSRRLEGALAALDAERVQGSRASRPRRRRQPAARAQRGANRAALLGVVSERPGVSVGEVASATGIARPTVASTLSKLVADGALERVELPGGTRGYRLLDEAALEPSADGDGLQGGAGDGEELAELPADA